MYSLDGLTASSAGPKHAKIALDIAMSIAKILGIQDEEAGGRPITWHEIVGSVSKSHA